MDVTESAILKQVSIPMDGSNWGNVSTMLVDIIESSYCEYCNESGVDPSEQVHCDKLCSEKNKITVKESTVYNFSMRYGFTEQLHWVL